MANTVRRRGGTDRDDPRFHRSTRHGRPHRRWLAAFTLISTVLLLSACVSGQARDQRAIETVQATQPDVLESVQKTTIAERFTRASPTAQPSVTPEPVANALVLSSSANPDGSPGNPIDSVTGFDAGTVYACVQLSHVATGQTVIGVWATIGGSEAARSEQKIGNAQGEQWVALNWQKGGGAPPGMYAVTVYVDQVDNQHKVTSLAFRVN